MANIIFLILSLLGGIVIGIFLTFYIIFKRKIKYLNYESNTKNRRTTKK